MGLFIGRRGAQRNHQHRHEQLPPVKPSALGHLPFGAKDGE